MTSEFYEARWPFLASLFWPLFGAAIFVVVEGVDSVRSRDGGWLAKGAAALAVVVIVIAIRRTASPALVFSIEPERITMRCRRHDLGWLSRYRLRPFEVENIEHIEIGVRTDFPLTSTSRAFYDVYVVVETREPLSAADKYSYAPLRRIGGWKSLVLALTNHPRLAGKVTVGALRASQSHVSRATLNLLSQPLRIIRRAIRGRERSSQ